MTILLWPLAFFLFASISHPQSLAETAKKEKERREKYPTTKVYRNKDLKATDRGNLSVVGAESDPEEVEARRLARVARESERDAHWRKVYASFKTRFTAVETSRNGYRDQFVNGSPAGADGRRIPCRQILPRWHLPGWTQHAITCESIEEKLKELETEMKVIEDECLDEARKMSIPPGKARLR